jgi:Kef-type K+ transport system membrane component KefB
MKSSTSLPYHEPSIDVILVQSSLLILLNVVNKIVDSVLYCGLLGQIFLGIAWGTPGGKFLTEEAEHTIVQLGYLGLLLLVFDGGLSTDFHSLKANIFLSMCVALTGICAPIGLSYILLPLVDATPLEAFAAGAALCATSLGTTFTVLGTTGLATTRMGVVLSSAAMMDDVVGLVMVDVISSLGSNSSSFSATVVIRPVFVAIAFAVVVPVAGRWFIQPLTIKLNAYRVKHPKGRVNMVLSSQFSGLVIHTLLLIGLVAGSSYAGTSNLFAAYIAGALINWWDNVVPHPKFEGNQCPSGENIYNTYFAPVVKQILVPFFFASIGFSIPISEMFKGEIIWRGIVYAVLMTIGKLLCGLWLVRIQKASDSSIVKQSKKQKFKKSKKPTTKAVNNTSSGISKPEDPSEKYPNISPETLYAKPAKKPTSLYPALILGHAMVARGEIGFLISSISQSTGIFNPDLFLITTWAILLCTIIGPLIVGTLVRRVKNLEAKKPQTGTNDHVLGVWGVQ